nr:hypothetical protein [uncultured Duganella sp.]
MITSAVRTCLCSAAVLLDTMAFASAEPPFKFESVVGLDEMAALIQTRFPLGSSRENLRRVFVDEGHATIKAKVGDPAIEKYI